MSSLIVTKLAFKGLSHEPHSKLTCPFSSGTEGLSNRSSRMTPSLCCSTYSIPISFTLSTQKSRTINCFKSKYASLVERLYTLSQHMKGDAISYEPNKTKGILRLAHVFAESSLVIKTRRASISSNSCSFNLESLPIRTLTF